MTLGAVRAINQASKKKTTNNQQQRIRQRMKEGEQRRDENARKVKATLKKLLPHT